MTSRSATLKALLGDRSTPPLLLPGAANALAARVAEEVGFPAVYVTGAGVANTFLGAPDIGLLTLTEITAHVAAIREAVEVPLIVDADTGFGNAIGVRRAVRELERAGANGIQLEDQQSPKRCGHFDGKELITKAEMVQKIHAAVDARTDPALQVIARTDARAVEGFDAAVERALAYAEAGADVLFLEAPQDLHELSRVPGLLPRPCLLNLVEGGKTPLVTAAEAEGYAVVLFANAALQAAVRAMRDALGLLRETGSLTAVADQLAPWKERQDMVRKPFFDALDERYS